jgi:hypothetical protein
MKRKTEQDYCDLATGKGFKWIGPFPKNTKTTTWWECEKMHRWESRYNDIQSGYGCLVCSGKAPKTEQDYYDLTKSKGVKWVGKKLPKNSHTKTWWECSKHHTRQAAYSSIQRGDGCLVCAGQAPKTEQDYNSLAENRGFKWVGSILPKNIMTKTWWECEKGHQWEAVYNNIHGGNGCPVCVGHAKKTEYDYHSLAKSRGFKWIGKMLPKNNQIKTWWECEKSHQWEAVYNNIYNGTGCPYCDDRVNGQPVSKPQRKLNTLLCGVLNYPEDRYRIDVAIMRNSQKIAVEYDAQYWHCGNEEHEIKRDKYLINKGWKVIHIKSGEMLPIRKQLKKAINKILNNEDVVNIFLEDWKT